jgi:hypothetical protein
MQASFIYFILIKISPYRSQKIRLKSTIGKDMFHATYKKYIKQFKQRQFNIFTHFFNRFSFICFNDLLQICTAVILMIYNNQMII